MKKQHLLLSAILNFHRQGLLAIKRGADINAIISSPLREAIGRARYIKEENIEQISDLLKHIDSELEKLSAAQQPAPTAAAKTPTPSES